ncbi:4-oxalocrotonate tautomerase family protein [Domibacillus sp. A3M-37]|uniref:2-hydroxymuconate tautomerase n=1 Tax=Domibacillus TaxID=1433999 RepID=UPI000617CCA3|nr:MULTISPECIES: 2-hydroxymuconate tautomerase [Domibacillus]MCP3764325.1 4-oxalocrotonate tautomerase family protein [Domibacillus sp. A3M-37]
MPFITVKVLEGKTPEQKRDLVKRMTAAVKESFDVDADKVFVFFEDLKPNDYGKQGELYSFKDEK